MKYMKYLVLLGLIALMAVAMGCAQEQPTGAAVAPPAPQPQAPVSEPFDMDLRVYVISILGKEGFDPSSTAVETGDNVVWKNNDPMKKDLTLTFQKEGSREFATSTVIKYGQTYTKVFEETDTYAFWTVAYGVKGEVVVG